MPAVVTYSPTGDAYINGVLGETRWAANSFTYSFPTSASFYGSSYGDGEPANRFEVLNPMQQAMTRTALTMFAAVANLTFAEVTETATRHADLRFAMSDEPGTAWAYFPSTNAAGGDAWFNNSSGQYDNPQLGNYAAATFIHEIGHALGLEHAHEAFVMPHDRDSMEYTVMSYRSHIGASTTSGYVNEKWGYVQSLMVYDIAALQHMYGANYSTNAGNTTYAWSPSTGELFVDGVGQGALGGNRIFMTVWDGGGTDTYDFSQYAGALKIDLRPGGWTTTSMSQLARLHYSGSHLAAGNIANALLHRGDTRSLIENAFGGSGDDSITGNQVANLLKGGLGSDLLTGGMGNDVLDGGAGSDTAVYGGQRGQYGIARLSDGSIQVSDLRSGAPDGTDSIWGVEWLRFADGTYSAGDFAPAIATTSSVVPPPPTTAPLPAAEPPVVASGGAGKDKLYGNGGNDRLYGRAGNDALHGAAGADRLDGGTGTDSASYLAAAAGVLADLLSPKANRGDAQGDIFVSIENVTGSAHADSLRGTNAANTIKGAGGSDTLLGRGGNDWLDGGADNDVLQGGVGRDILVGGTGKDLFVFKSLSESRGSLSDTIKDFVRGHDRIDLRSIDANSHAGGNQSFSFIGKSAFAGKAGQLRFASGLLEGDVNGDGHADFQVKVVGPSVLVKGDFYL